MADERLFGKYRLVRRIAFGGMAEVFLARLIGEEGFEKIVVLKRILPQFSADPDFTRMFIDEALLAAKLTHPNIVQVYDFGQVDDIYFIAMEYVDGVDLRKLIRAAIERNRVLTPVEVAAIGEGMARGLSYVHSAESDGRPLGIVHRDISPHNVMLSRTGDVKIMDFGIAKAAERATQTATGTIKGKLAYMAPEQALGEEVDKLSDQFAVGLVLWECLAGKRLFEGESEPELMSRVAAGRVRKLRDFVPNVPDALDRAIMRALSVDRALRYPDLRDLERELANFRYGLGSAGAVRLSELMEELIPREPSRPAREAGTMELSVGEVGLVGGDGSNSGMSATARPSSTARLATDHPSSASLLGPHLSNPSLSMQSGWTFGAATDPTRFGQTRGSAPTRMRSTPDDRHPVSFTATRIAETNAKTGPTSHRHRHMLLGAGVAIAVAAAVAAGVIVRNGGLSPRATLVIESDPAGAVLFVSATPGAPVLPTGLVTPAPIRGHAVGDTVRWRVEMTGMFPLERTTTITGGVQHENVVLEKLREVAVAPTPDASATATTTPAPTVPEPKPEPRLVTQARRAAKADKSKKLPTGLLSLHTRGGQADVYLNEKFIGRTPFSRAEVPTGILTLEVRDANHVSHFITVEVTAGGLVDRTIDVK